MLFQLNSSEWRILRRLHLAGGSATWSEVRPMARKQIEDRAKLVLVSFGLVVVDGENWRITDRGREVQELGEANVSIEEFRSIAKKGGK